MPKVALEESLCDGRGAHGHALAKHVQLKGQLQERRKFLYMPKRWLLCFSGLFDHLGFASVAKPGSPYSIQQQHLRCKVVGADCLPCASSAVIVHSREMRSSMGAL